MCAKASAGCNKTVNTKLKDALKGYALCQQAFRQINGKVNAMQTKYVDKAAATFEQTKAMK